MRVWTKPAGMVKPPVTTPDEIVLTCQFITPVFGGGVDPKQFDPITPVRASAIRGQLRYWWRATHADLTLDELRARETELFGGVQEKKSQGNGARPKGPTASAISIHVAKQPARPKRLEVFERGNAFKLAGDRLDALAYGAFPLRAIDAAKIHDVLFVYDSSFEIAIHCGVVKGTDVRAELDRALWAWLHFGGLGARTRRGFGALKLVSAKGWELKGIHEGWPAEPRRDKVKWPVLPASAESIGRAKKTMRTGREAQEELLRLLRDMRQGDLGRKPNKPRPGRSYWPEPDNIRKLYGINSGRHAVPIHDPRIDRFPRAAFGTPIIFHFKSEPGEREPPDTTLVPAHTIQEKGKDERKPFGRFASSLILRPHASGEGTFEAMAVHLEHPEPEMWVLVEKKTIKARVLISLNANDAKRITPLQVDKRTHNDPIEAYLARLAMI